MENVLAKQLLQVAETIEQKIDQEIQRLDELDMDSIENIREHRLQQMKKMIKQKEEWVAKGHGDYEELSDEKGFFEKSKISPNMVLHFYKDGSQRCKIVDHHLQILCKQHLETRFCKLNVTRFPFLTERMKIRVIPTIVSIVDSISKDFIVGFTELGNCDDFSTEMLEWRLARSKVIDYKGDLLNPPDVTKNNRAMVLEKKKTIRGKLGDEDSDGLDSD
ncbi:thioredoxin domain-containing protein 9 [Adelges cooleyi]|uniref:thioredoxin domain-containing protein 9 n=1 Tax=Adelges cooleyi TaxID=133065 RepID=UPI00217FB751|nr:thioredoxin domain-containing protein 9 [Adelges cooleyi]XP_050436201.1 thioredoxin domain-containing protein 9 [Adelges cooleyi]